jgi:hypothetical protein
MKWMTIFLLLFSLNSCNNRADKNSVDDKAKKIHFDSSYIDSMEINVDSEQSFNEYKNCNFDELIEDKKTPKLAKDIYLNNDWNLNNDVKTLALLDSLTAKNKQSRPFYFKVVTKTYLKSDGYFSEELGLVGKEYVENNTKEFISYFDDQGCFTENDLLTWAKIIILELSISVEGEYDKPIIDNYFNKLKSNCINCSLTQKQNINKLGLTLKKEWKEFLKTIE